MTAYVAATALPLAVAIGVVGVVVVAVLAVLVVRGERRCCEWAQTTDSEETTNE